METSGSFINETTAPREVGGHGFFDDSIRQFKYDKNCDGGGREGE
jgi:hypothetical protein